MPQVSCKMKHYVKISQTHLKSKHSKHFCLILIPVRFVECYIDNSVLCFAKSDLWNWKLSRPGISVWFCRFVVWFFFWVSGFRNCVQVKKSKESKDFVCKIIHFLFVQVEVFCFLVIYLTFFIFLTMYF